MASRKVNLPLFDIILKTDRTLKDGSHPVSIRVTFRGERKYYTIGKCTPDQWLPEASRYRKDKEENARLSMFEIRARKIIQEYEESERQFTFQRFETSFFVNSELKKVLNFINNEIDKLIDADRAGSLSLAKTLRNSLTRFREGKDFLFADVDQAFLERYEKFLLKTCTINGINVYMRTFRGLFNKAIKAGLAKREWYPFNDYAIKSEPTRKRALQRSQIAMIINYPVQEGSRLFHSKNYFVFSYLTRGMNFIDIARLRFENILEDRINYVRTKTRTSRSKGEGKIFSIPIRGMVKEMISYYRRNYFTGAGYIFPILTKKYETNVAEKYAIQAKADNVNEDIQTICQALEIPNGKEITMYVARHSWATISKKQGARTELIQEGMGHGDVKTTEIYLAQFDHEELDKVDQHLEEFSTFKFFR